MNKTVQAFDRSAIFEGNRALEIDHETVALAVDQLLSSMTLTDKLDQLRGSQTAPVAGLYHAGGNTDLAIPAFKMVDGPRGARAGEATAFPVAMQFRMGFSSDDLPLEVFQRFAGRVWQAT